MSVDIKVKKDFAHVQHLRIVCGDGAVLQAGEDKIATNSWAIVKIYPGLFPTGAMFPRAVRMLATEMSFERLRGAKIEPELAAEWKLAVDKEEMICGSSKNKQDGVQPFLNNGSTKYEDEEGGEPGEQSSEDRHTHAWLENRAGLLLYGNDDEIEVNKNETPEEIIKNSTNKSLETLLRNTLLGGDTESEDSGQAPSVQTIFDRVTKYAVQFGSHPVWTDKMKSHNYIKSVWGRPLNSELLELVRKKLVKTPKKR